MNEETQKTYLSVLASLKVAGPKRLQPRLDLDAEGLDLDVSLPSLLQHLRTVGPNDQVKQAFSLQFALWDNADESESWTDGHARWTTDRRNLIYRLLGMPDDCQSVLTGLFPIKHERNIVIAADFEPWYTSQLQRGSFYWPAYERYLTTKPGWDAESVADLSVATSDIVQRLSDPARVEAYQSKGLVVGYVQSGKTANITGVLARAIDAGYKLLIVMTGTIDLLREQTQRRIDMELVGVENILRGIDPDDPELAASVDYQDDPDWERFVKYGFLPSSQNIPDIIRLTRHRFAGKTGDYKSLLTGVTALEMEKHDKTFPLNHRTNLERCAARLVVVKKNSAVLKKLVRDLKTVRPRLGEIPALVIDDESDHASVNTIDPRKWQAGQKKRTAINNLIAELLQLLPRAQYVGYTATPFANVFIDPDDAEDIFPKDFIITLARPPDYMGASDFHDLEPEIDEAGKILRGPQEAAHVRDLGAPEDDREARAVELERALGMFLLTGAMKLFREQQGRGPFRHHTMLAHESVRRDEHRELADEVRRVWRTAAFSSPSGLAYLRTLYREEIETIHPDLRKAPPPARFEDLKPHIGEAISRITVTGDPVIIVNSDNDMKNESVDFDRRRVWRVLVGGAKLSRGFTVEGLTISYYRRRTGQADTLMQMGRWFGFRKGYRDLVRLYIDRRVRSGRKTVDLYEAFGAVMRAEELFRDELRRYAELVDGKPQIRPAEVPPLVTQHLPWLRPTARNKMFNARVAVVRWEEIEPVAYPDDRVDIRHNYDAMKSLILEVLDAGQEATFAFPKREGQGKWTAMHRIVKYDNVLAALRKLRWNYSDRFGDHFAPYLAFLEEGREEVDEWIVLTPVLRNTKMWHSYSESHSVGVAYRQRRSGTLFQTISEPGHRHVAKRIAGIASDEFGEDKVADSLRSDRRGVLIIYSITDRVISRASPCATIAADECIIAFHIVVPTSARRPDLPYVGFKVHREDLADEVVVADPQSSATGSGEPPTS